jgi:hypothetical protein
LAAPLVKKDVVAGMPAVACFACTTSFMPWLDSGHQDERMFFSHDRR